MKEQTPKSKSRSIPALLKSPRVWFIIALVSLTRVFSYDIVFWYTDTFDKTREKSSICSLHQAEMRTEIVPVIYGYQPSTEVYPEMYADEKEKMFPNGIDYTYGGCYGSPQLAVVYLCDACEKNCEKWKRKR